MADTDIQAQKAAESIIRNRASRLANAILLSLTEADTGQLKTTPAVESITSYAPFQNLYASAAKELGEIGTPSVEISPARVISHMIEHHSNALQTAIALNLDLAKLFTAYATAENIAVPVQMHTPPRQSIHAEPTASPTIYTPAKAKSLTQKQERVAQARGLSERVLFDTDGTLNPSSPLTNNDAVNSAFQSYKSQRLADIGIPHPIGDAAIAGEFVTMVLDDAKHPAHEALRESLIKAGKALPPEQPARTKGGISDAVRAKLAADIDAGASMAR